MRCDYCRGDIDGFVSYLPKTKPCNGNAMICESREETKLLISLPFNRKLEYKVNYCPMCGKKFGRKEN